MNERCVLALTNEDSIILDPYAGVGATAIASIKNNRKIVAIEKEKKYIDITKKRIKAYKSGNLKIRPMTKSVHIPKATDKVAQYPNEWKAI